MNRRDILLSTLAFALTAKPALARPPFTLKGDPAPMLSPPFKDGEGRNLMLSDFAGRDISNALQILNPGGAVVCHDLNPGSEEMQKLPRQTSEWTGDCWKAWVRVRREQPDLPMAVANTDYGVGIILPAAKFSTPKIAMTDDEMTWDDFDRERREWLNLLPPGELSRVLFGDSGDESGLTVVTLWRGEWNPVQADLLCWMVKEDFPRGTRFVWVAPEGSTAEFVLEKAWEEFDAREDGYRCDFVPTHAVAVRNNVEKHHLVAALYNEALRGVRSEWVMFIEDDVVPAAGGAEKLLGTMLAQSPDTAVVAAVYRSRWRPNAVCATDTQGAYLKWPDDGEYWLVEVLWSGGGFAIYRGTALRGAGTLFAKSDRERLWGGWDVNLCKALRKNGYRVFVNMGTRAEHRF